MNILVIIIWLFGLISLFISHLTNSHSAKRTVFYIGISACILSGIQLIHSNIVTKRDAITAEQKAETAGVDKTKAEALQIAAEERLKQAELEIEKLKPPSVKRRIGNFLRKINPKIETEIKRDGSKQFIVDMQPHEKDALRELWIESHGRLLQIDTLGFEGQSSAITTSGRIVSRLKIWVSSEVYINPDDPYVCEKKPENLEIPDGLYLLDQFINIKRTTPSN